MDKQQNTFKQFLFLWTGQLISAIGSGMTSFGLAAYIFMQTGKVSDVAMLTLIAFLPGLIVSPIAGVFADKYDRRLLMIVGDGLSVSGLLLIFITLYSGELVIWKLALGVGISSVFSALIEPAYKSTVTDLLTKEQYTKASGMIQIAGAAKFLISPMIAGILLANNYILFIIIIDMVTFVITVLTTAMVRKSIPKHGKKTQDFSLNIVQNIRIGWEAITRKKGVLILVLMTSGITFFIGMIQVLLGPLILSFSDAKALGICQTLSALGMLFSSILLGLIHIRKHHEKILFIALALSGFFMSLYGVRANMILITIAGFFFFATLPFINAMLDYLLRTSIDNSVQGRAWGLIGLLSQLGYIIAYSTGGYLADAVFEPIMQEKGRGIGLVIILSGLLLVFLSILIQAQQSIRLLAKEGVELCMEES